ncbi:MAG: ADP-ribose pyrophosphatase [Lentimonas sp.]|jgi:ADP-ribose pyrophosphatase
MKIKRQECRFCEVNKMKEIKHTVIANTRWLKLVEAEVEIRGVTQKWTYCTRRQDLDTVPATPDAVVIVPFVREAGETRILLVHEYRTPINRTMYAFPAGLVDDGESVETSAARELLEETGCRVVSILDQSPPTLYPSAGLTDETFQYVFVEAAYQGEPQLEGSEEIELHSFTLDALRALLETQPAMCGRTWPLCYQYLQNYKFPI